MGRSDPNSQFDLAHLAIWARRAPPGPATYLPHPTNGCPACPSSQAACGKPGFAQGPLQGREIARDAIWGNLGHMLSMRPDGKRVGTLQDDGMVVQADGTVLGLSVLFAAWAS